MESAPYKRKIIPLPAQQSSCISFLCPVFPCHTDTCRQASWPGKGKDTYIILQSVTGVTTLLLSSLMLTLHRIWIHIPHRLQLTTALYHLTGILNWLSVHDATDSRVGNTKRKGDRSWRRRTYFSKLTVLNQIAHYHLHPKP